MNKKILFLWLCFSIFPVFTAELDLALEKARVDLTDLPALQRGAKLFMNYCSACHSLKYVRYEGMAQEIGIVDSRGQVLKEVLKKNLVFGTGALSDPIQTAMPRESAVAWFGVAPPDLSLVARVRGGDWLYSYLRSFYLDAKRPWGVNNHVFPDVAMPDVLLNFRNQLLTEPNGQSIYDRAILDIVHFLAYTAEPVQLLRKKIGLWVLLFLGVFCIFACLLKREYWKDID